MNTTAFDAITIKQLLEKLNSRHKVEEDEYNRLRAFCTDCGENKEKFNKVKNERQKIMTTETVLYKLLNELKNNH